MIAFPERLVWLLPALMLSACQPAPSPGWSGYVEGDYVYVSSALGGTVTYLAVRSGQEVVQGAPLFSLDAESEDAAVQEAQARLDRATAQQANLGKGRRQDEIAVIQAQIRQASAQRGLAAAALAREDQLLKQGFVSLARRDDLRTALAQSEARWQELQAQLRVAQLPARADERTAAAAEANAGQQAVRQLAWREAQKTRTAPATARVTDTYFSAGEWVQPGQPVVALLPPDHVKVRFFVPEGVLGAVQVGNTVQIRCDACGEPINAHISFIASRAEYTPPVIYSNAQRAKLVFMVEARPSAQDSARLKPGQPVDVSAVKQDTP
jgi:HlyD family secretion protein